MIRVNLNWHAQAAGGIDLDLGALYESTDGQKGVVQALGNSFGNLYAPPYVFLDGDDRSGTNTAGENLWINLDHAYSIRRVLVFAYIYEGAASFDYAQGVVTVFPAAGPQIEVRLDDPAGGARFCAIACCTLRQRLAINREIRFSKAATGNGPGVFVGNALEAGPKVTNTVLPMIRSNQQGSMNERIAS